MYKVNRHGGVIRLADGANIPEAPGNKDWEEYQEWVNAGNTADPADPAPVFPADEGTMAEIAKLKADVGSLNARVP